MRKPGRKPTPTAKLANRGSWRAKTRKNEPKVQAGAPECPDWLQGECREIWGKLVPELVNMGIMTRLDDFAFSRYCVYAVLWLKELGNSYRTEATLERYANQCLKIEAAFGLTPADRTRLSVSQPPSSDDFIRIV